MWGSWVWDTVFWEERLLEKRVWKDSHTNDTICSRRRDGA